MFTNCLLALTLAGLAYTVVPAVTQDSGGQAPSNDQQQSAPAGEADHGGRRHFDPAMRTQRLTKELKLNSDQQSKVLDITKAEQTQMESVHSDASLSQQDRRAKMMDIHKTSDDQIRALLDGNQQKKFDAMQTRREQWGGGHNHGGGGQNPPPDAPQQN